MLGSSIEGTGWAEAARHLIILAGWCAAFAGAGVLVLRRKAVAEYDEIEVTMFESVDALNSKVETNNLYARLVLQQGFDDVADGVKALVTPRSSFWQFAHVTQPACEGFYLAPELI